MADLIEDGYDLTREAARGLLEFVTFTLELVQDSVVTEHILNALGVEADGPVGAPDLDQSAFDAIETFAGSEDAATLAELVVLLEQIDNLVTPVRTWFGTLLQGQPEAVLRQLSLKFVQLFMYLYIREKHPEKLRLVQTFGIIRDGLPDFEAFSVSYSVIKDFLVGEFFTEPERGGFAALAGAWFAAELWSERFEPNAGMLFGWQAPKDSPTPEADKIANRTLTVTYGHSDIEQSGGLQGKLGLVWVSDDHVDDAGLMYMVSGGFKVVQPIGTLELDWEVEAQTRGVFYKTTPNGDPNARSVLSLQRDTDLSPGRPTIPFGDSYFSLGHLQVRNTIASHRLDLDVSFGDSELFLKEPAKDSNWLENILPDKGLRARFTAGLKFDFLTKKVSLSEGTAMRAVLPVGGDGVLGVRVPYVTLAISDNPDSEGVDAVLELSATFEARSKYLTITVERVGLEVFIPRRDAPGLAGFIDIKPPSGAGIVLDAGSVTGGGYLFYDGDQGEWGGVLNLDIKQAVSLTALGLVKEDLPGAPDDYAMVIMGAAEFRPGLGPFFNCYLQGLGFIYVHNRTIDTDVLRAGVKTGLIDNVLFPENPVANAPQILNDMRRLFPVSSGSWAAAMLLKVGFGSGNSGRMKLGVALAGPDPNTLAVLGNLLFKLPDLDANKPIAQIEAEMALIWDEAARLVSFDAALRDSFVKHGLTLTGEMAMRWRYGDDGTVVLAIGGLHPSFDATSELPATAQMPVVERVAIALGSSSNPRVRAEGYLAYTSNSLQAGIRGEVTARKAGFTLEGWISVDGLLERESMQLVVEFSAGMQIRKGRRVLFSLTLEGRVELFSPIRISGKVKFRILFVTVKIPVSLNIGSDESLVTASIDLAPLLAEALQQDRAWGGTRPAGFAQVATTASSATAALRLRPSALPSVRQPLVPLGLTLDLFDGGRISGDRRFEVTEFRLNGRDLEPSPVEDHFAAGQFLDLSDDERLSRPSFETFAAGVTSADDRFDFGATEEADLGYETIIVDKRTDRRRRVGDILVDRAMLAHALPFAAAARPGARLEDRFAGAAGPSAPVVADPGGYVIATVADMSLADALTPAATTFAETQDRLAAHLAVHPEHSDRLQVVATHQVDANA